MEHGFFKRRNSANHQRNSERRDRERGGFRERNDYRNRERDREGFRERGGYRERPGNDRGFDGEESVFSKRVRAGKRRTYFFDVRKTRGDDYFITITESTRRDDGQGGYRRHKILLYKEDFNRFIASLNEVVDHVKTSLLPDFDYAEFDRRQAEWEAQQQSLSPNDKRTDDMADLDEEDFEEDFDDDLDDDLDEELDEEKSEDEDEKPRRKSSSRHTPPDDDPSW